MSMPYLYYPHTEELRDWNSRLLTLDGYVAGYATCIESGRMRAGQVPGIDVLILEVESLRRMLDSPQFKSGQENGLLSDYRSYVSALEWLVREIGAHAESADE